jgi:hypothetical protein
MYTLKFIFSLAIVSFFINSIKASEVACTQKNTTSLAISKTTSYHGQGQIQQTHMAGLFSCISKVKKRAAILAGSYIKKSHEMREGQDSQIQQITHGLEKNFSFLENEITSLHEENKKHLEDLFNQNQSIINRHSQCSSIFNIFCEKIYEMNRKIIESNPESSDILSKIEESLNNYKQIFFTKAKKEEITIEQIYQQINKCEDNYINVIQIMKNLPRDSDDDMEDLRAAVSDIKSQYEAYIESFGQKAVDNLEQLNLLFNKINQSVTNSTSLAGQLIQFKGH